MPRSDQLIVYSQASARSRGSISAQSMSLQRHRTGSVTTENRLRSDSNKTQSQTQDTESMGNLISHTIEPRAQTAQLPPVMVSGSSHVPSRKTYGLTCVCTGQNHRRPSAVLVGLRGRLYHHIVSRRLVGYMFCLLARECSRLPICCVKTRNSVHQAD